MAAHGGGLTWRAMCDAAFGALRRFPMALLAAAVGAWLVLDDDDRMLPWVMALAAAFFWSGAARLLLEWRARGPALVTEAVPWLVGLVCLSSALLGAAAFPIYALPVAGALAVVAVPLLAPARAATATVWAGQLLWISVLTVIAALVLLVGVSLILGTLDELFDTALIDVAARAVWTFGLGLLAPWLALAQVPLDTAGVAGFTLPGWVCAFLDWLLAPLTIVFTVVVNVYCLVILVQGELPRGFVAFLVLALAGVGGAIWAAAGSAHTGRGLTQVLRGWFLPALLAPALALFVAAWMRIEQHGITEPRYVIVAVAVLLLVLGAGQLVLREAPSPSVVAVAAAATLLAISAGPWGATATAVRSQLDRLTAKLEAAGRLRDDRIVAGDERLPRRDSDAVSSMLRFLVDRGAGQRIVADLGLDPAVAEDWRQMARSLGAVAAPDASRGENFYWYATPREPLDADGFATLVLRQQVSERSVASVGLRDKTMQIQLDFEAATLRFRHDDATWCDVDLTRALSPSPERDSDAIVVDAKATDGTRLRLILVQVDGRRLPDDRILPTSLTFHLLVGPAP